MLAQTDNFLNLSPNWGHGFNLNCGPIDRIAACPALIIAQGYAVKHPWQMVIIASSYSQLISLLRQQQGAFYNANLN